MKIDFPAEYPFKPPKITFQTKIYHPNIDEKGQVCLPIISPENWKPATRTDQGFVSFVRLFILNFSLEDELPKTWSFLYQMWNKNYLKMLPFSILIANVSVVDSHV